MVNSQLEPFFVIFLLRAVFGFEVNFWVTDEKTAVLL
jgi:hypothetical protein